MSQEGRDSGLLTPRWLKGPTLISNSLAVVSGAGIVVLMFISVIDVVLRQFFSSGLGGAIEISEILLVAVVFLALMAGEMTNTHVRTPVLMERMSGRTASIMHLVGLIPATVFLGWATFQTALQGLHSAALGEFRFGVIFVPIWPAKLIIPIGLAALTIAVVLKVITTVRNLVRAAPADISTHDNFL